MDCAPQTGMDCTPNWYGLHPRLVIPEFQLAPLFQAAIF